MITRLRNLWKKRKIFERVTLEPTTRCNLRCPSCGRPHGGIDMPMDVYKDILCRLDDQDVKRMDLLWRGEPTLHPQLPLFAEISSNEGYYTYTSTNCSTENLHNLSYVRKLLTHLDRIEICIDGWNQETISQARPGTDWNIVLQNLEVIGSIDTDCEKRLRVLMYRHNDGKQDFFRNLGKKYKLNVISFAGPILFKKTLSETEAEKLLSKDSRFQRYRRTAEGWVYRECVKCRPIDRPVITVTGDMAPCCYDWKAECTIGNILIDGPELIEKRYEDIRPRMTLKELPICKGCTLSTSGFKINYMEKIH